MRQNTKLGKLYDLTHDVKGQSEDALQQKCVFWFHNKFPELRGLLFHPANGGFRNAREGAKFKKIGVYPGVADLVFLYKKSAYFLELKDEKGRQSKNQELWEKKVKSQGYEYFIVRSLADFKNKVSSIMLPF